MRLLAAGASTWPVSRYVLGGGATGLGNCWNHITWENAFMIEQSSRGSDEFGGLLLSLARRNSTVGMGQLHGEVRSG